MAAQIGSPATFGMNSNVPSPTGDIYDELPNRFTVYLHQLAGSHENEVNIIMHEHCYSKPWNWRPENAYAKPIKKIFFPKASNLCRSSNDSHRTTDEIDVVSETNMKMPHQVHNFHPDEVANLPMDLNRARKLMDEFLRIADYVKTENFPDDWEERIDKTLWSPSQTRLFTRVLKILSSERLARLVKSGSFDEPIFRRNSVDTAARRFREALASVGWDIRIAQWLHCLLFEHLPHEYLPIYLDILQTLRAKIPQLIDKIIAAQPSLTGKNGAISWDTLGTLLKRSWDPVAGILNANKPKKLPGNPILVIAPSGSGATISSRQHKWISLLGMLGMVVNVPVHLGVAAFKMTMMTCIEQLVQATRSKIQDVRADCPGRPIVLVGFNSGAALACQIAQMELVTAVICIGFPFMTVEGKRGSPDDTLMDIRCPVMFVIGQNANLVRVDDLENVREHMVVPTSLVVVGSADDHLRITTAKKISEGITQSMVDRCILDEIGDFVGGILLQPHPLPLRPIGPNVSVGALANLDCKSKKDSDKRKNSTSSGSVESEPNSPNAKKSRPNTPVSSSMMSSYANSASNSLPKTSVPLTASTNSCSNLMGGQNPSKRKPRGMSSGHRTQYAEHPLNSKFSSQIPNNGAGGITLNIGTLASLAPIGPLRLGLNQSGSTVASPPKAPPVQAQTKNYPARAPKMTLPSATVTPKIRTMLPTKGFSKISPSHYKQHVMNDPDILDPRQVNLTPSSSTNQMRHSNPAMDVDGGAVVDQDLMKSRRHQMNQSEPLKAPKPLTKITVKPPKSTPSEVAPPDYDLGNILDLPIIFAKDDDNLSSIQVNPPEKRPTKVVLISNKQQDKRPPGAPSITANSVPNARHPAANQNAAKYTKIILSKKRDKINPEGQVVLTKRPPVSRITQSSRIYSHEVAPSGYMDDAINIEDAITANIIQRVNVRDEERDGAR